MADIYWTFTGSAEPNAKCYINIIFEASQYTSNVSILQIKGMGLREVK